MKGPILVIDDDREIRESLSDVLIDEGYAVICAGNGREGLDYLNGPAAKPCLIFLDLMMPVLDGQGFRKEQLAIPAISNIPTILFSANGQLDKRAIDIGIADFVKKPIDLDELLSIAAKFC
jgi:CheY-like chemotaxis protein